MKKYFITGVSRGLGLELMRQLVARGDFVYSVSRTEPPNDPVLKAFDENWIWRSCDLMQSIDIKQIFEHQKSIQFLPDVVILNAGAFSRDEDEFLLEKYLDLLKVNSLGALTWVQSYLKDFEKRDSGHFVYISSLSSIYPFPMRANYSASKTYASMVFECLRKRYVATGLDFSVFYLGVIETEMSAGAPISDFFKFPVSKAAKKILGALPKGSQSISFPLRFIILEWVLAILPGRFILGLISQKQTPPR